MSWWIFIKIESSEEMNIIRWKMLTVSLFHCKNDVLLLNYMVMWSDLTWFGLGWCRVWEPTKIRSWKCCALAPMRNSTKFPTFISLVMIQPKCLKRNFFLTGKQGEEWMFFIVALQCSERLWFPTWKRTRRGRFLSCCWLFLLQVFRQFSHCSRKEFSSGPTLRMILFSFLPHLGQPGWVQQTQSHPSQVRRGGPRQGLEEMEHGCGSVHRHLYQSQFRPATRNHQRIREAVRHGHWDRDPARNERRFGEILSHFQ